ncbi:MFS transporter [Bifidobacterium adolescentis]
MRIREGEPVAERDHHGDRPEEDAPAEGRTAEELTPDTGKPVSKLNLERFGAGFIFFCIVFMMSGTIGSTVLLPARFNTLGIGQGETILGTMNSIGIIFALISNVIFGSLSDASHSRFGKRTPWIIIGGPIAGIGFYLTSISPTLPTIVASWSLLQISLNCMIAPCVAILSDRVPQKYRGSMSAFYGAGQIVGQSMGTIIGSAFIDAPKTGFMIDTICWCLCGIGTVLLLPRELSAATADAERFDIRQIAMQFRPPTKGARDFYLALVGRLMLIFGYNMIVGYQLYVCMKYIGQDAKAAASTVSTMAVITMVVPPRRTPGLRPDLRQDRQAQATGVRLLHHHRHRHRRAVGAQVPVLHVRLRGAHGPRIRHLHGGRSGAERRRATEPERGRQGSRHPEPRQHTRTGYRADCRLLHRGGHRRLLLSIPDRHRGRNDRCRGDSVHQEGEVAAGGS